MSNAIIFLEVGMTNIYCITNTLNGKRYVGKTKYSIEKRFEQHSKASNKINTYIHNAILKYGKESFTIELVAQVQDEDWKYWERYYIKKYHSHFTEGGYNITYGGDSNPMDIPEVKEIQKRRCKEKPYEKRANWLGKHHSEESRKKMSRVQSVICNTEERRERNALQHEKQKKRVGMLSMDGNLVRIFDSLTDAVGYLGGDLRQAGSVGKYVDKFNKNGKRSRYLGYSWTYNLEDKR